MVSDSQYSELAVGHSEIQHEYGEHVHILSHPVVLTELAKLCSAEVVQPEFNRLIRSLYNHLIRDVVGKSFPRRRIDRDTRMKSDTDQGVYRGMAIDPTTPAVTVDIARAGIVPSDVCFLFLNELMSPENIRQDHLILSRQVDDSGGVQIDVCADKLGGSIEDNIVIFPDPMGATGSSLETAISFYKDQMSGTARTLITANLIVTPEFISTISENHPDVEIFAARLDRGMSTERALDAPPGAYPDEESGLNDKKYIVPGGGGFGELMNNAWD